MTGRNRNHRSRDPFAAYPRAAGSRWDEDMLAMSDEALALLGASLEPVEPPASLRAELLERIRPKEEPAEPAAGAPPAGITAESAGDEATPGGDAAGTTAQAAAAGPRTAGPEPDQAGSRSGSAGPGPDQAEPDSRSAAAVAPAEETSDDQPGAVVPLRPRRRRWLTAGLRIAAAIVILGVGIGLGRWTAPRSVTPAPTDGYANMEDYAHLNQAQDVQRVTDTMPDGHIATLTWSQGMSMTALSLPEEMMEAAADSSLQVWLRKGEDVSSLGLYDPASGAGFTFLDLMPEEGEQIFITQEPVGGSDQPTGEALVAFDVNADGTTTRSSPTPSGTPSGGAAGPAPTPSGRPSGSASTPPAPAPSGHQSAKPTGKAKT